MNRSAKTEGIFQPQTLDVDESIINRALKIVDDDVIGGGSDVTGSGLFPSSGRSSSSAAKQLGLKSSPLLPAENLPVIKVTPNPGLCVKTRNVEGGKVFVNVCKIQEIPPPPPLTEDKLKEMIANEDYSSDFRVPMSLGSPRQEKDKSGGECLACDVAINAVWFDDVMFDSIAFTTFVVNVAMEGLCEKYGDTVNLDRQNWTILKNKKYLGNLQKHHIQQRANTPGDNVRITEISEESTVKYDQPEYLMVKENPPEHPDRLVVSIKVPDHVTKTGLQLDVGEDRLIFSSKKSHLDIFLPFDVDQELAEATFDTDEQNLVVKMPLLVHSSN